MSPSKQVQLSESNIAGLVNIHCTPIDVSSNLFCSEEAIKSIQISQMAAPASQDASSHREKDIKMHKAIRAASALLVEYYLKDDADPNAPHPYQYEATHGPGDFPGFSSNRQSEIVLVPPLHLAVRTCYDHSKCETKIEGGYEYGSEGFVSAEKILKILLEQGANPLTEASFTACLPNDVRKQFSGSALAFAIFLKQHVDSRYREFNGKSMDAVIRILQKSSNAAGDGSVRMVNVPKATHLIWSSLLLSKRFSDVAFETQDEILPAHKCVLSSASPYFAALFSERWNEQGCRNIKTSNSPKIMRALLSFIYTGSVQESMIDTSTSELLSCACEYDLPPLKSLCEQKFIARLEISNVRDMLLLSQLHRCDALKRSSFSFIGLNASKVLIRPEIMALAREDPTLWAELVQMIGGHRV